MTTNHHTPPVDGAPANMSVIRAPLSELDAAITDHETRIGTLEGDMPVPSGSPIEYYDGDGNWTVPAGTGASVDGHVIKDEGVSLPQRASIDFVGAGVTVTNEAGGTQVAISGDHGGLTGLTDPDHVASSIGFTATDILLGRSSSGAGIGEEIPLTAVGRALIDDANAAAQRATLELDRVAYPNSLINGGFDFWQRINPTAAKTMTNDAYNAADRWYSLIQGSGATINRDAGIGVSRYSAKLVAGGTTNRYGIAQIIEASNSFPYRGKTITAQIRVKPVNNAGSGTRTYRIAVLEWTGTANTVTSELVANWASSTFTTAGFFASTTKTLVGTANVTATHNVESVLSVTGLVSASCNNLIVFVWTENTPTHAADYALFGEVMLFGASNVQEWIPRHLSQEFLLCQRHYWSTFKDGVAPAQNVGDYLSSFRFATQIAGAQVQRSSTYAFPVPMFAVPTVTIYSPMLASSEVYDAGISQTCTSTSVPATFLNEKSFCVNYTGHASGSVGNALTFAATAEAEL